VIVRKSPHLQARYNTDIETIFVNHLVNTNIRLMCSGFILLLYFLSVVYLWLLITSLVLTNLF